MATTKWQYGNVKHVPPGPEVSIELDTLSFVILGRLEVEEQAAVEVVGKPEESLGWALISKPQSETVTLKLAALAEQCHAFLRLVLFLDVLVDMLHH